MRFGFERVRGIDIAVGRTSGRETFKVACDGRGGKGEMASHAHGTATRREGESDCLDGPLSDVSEEGDHFDSMVSFSVFDTQSCVELY